MVSKNKDNTTGGAFASVAAPPLPGVLVRNSRLSSDYIKENLDAINMAVRVVLDGNFKHMTEDWSAQELLHERRLVKLTVNREGPNLFHIATQSVSPDYGVAEKNVLIISCIRWEERNTFVLTSVDLLHVLEHLVGETFTTQEKSRIRRNLQFLHPITVNRTSSARLFNAVMAMENPRPRNIEKDLKVFKWLSMNVALTKVLSKYSVNPAIASDTASLQEGNGSNGSLRHTVAKQPFNLRADVQTNTNLPLPVNSFTALPRSIASKAISKENRPRPRTVFECKPSNNQVGASNRRIRSILEQNSTRYISALSVF